MTPEQRGNFNRLLNPKHIAFVGGADAITAINEARRRGFRGDMWAVNPNRPDLAGVPCFATVDDLPQAPDAAYVAIPAMAAVDVVAKLAAMGAGGVVCYSAGFKEAGPQGAKAEAAMKQVAGDMALIGPNCYGVINYLGNSALWSFEHGGSSPGYGAAIITQSGMFSSDITMSQRSLPLAYMISSGNQAVMGQEDFLDVLCEDPAVRAIGLHIEGLQDVRKFERAALKALELGTPVVALKSGTSAIGGALTISHTGSLSGANELYEALFARTGVISVTSPSQLIETLKYLCVVGAPAGTRVAGFTCSGGGATMMADHGEKIGLSFPEISEDATERLTGLLPELATVSNPLDYTTPIWGQPEHTRPVFAAAMQGIEADAAVLVQDYPLPELDQSKSCYQNDAAAFADAVAAKRLPAAICATIPENLDTETRELLISRGVAPMQGIHETLNALADAAAWTMARQSIVANPPLPLMAGSAPTDALRMASEAQGKAWVASAAIAVPEGRCVASAEAVKAASDIGFPVALKMMGPKLAHKTEVGAVALSLQSEHDVEHAIERMRCRVAAYDAAAVTDDFLVEKMCSPPLAELIVGVRRDPQFGYALTLGSGGILVELIGDAKTLLLPCTPAEIEMALSELKVGKLLNGYRGGTAVDIGGIADRLHGLCAKVLDSRDDLGELEINPLFVYSKTVVAVDVLMHRRGGT